MLLDISSWTWGLVLIVFTTAIHSFGIALLALLGTRIRDYFRSRGPLVLAVRRRDD
jgi:hypothetical protein